LRLLHGAGSVQKTGSMVSYWLLRFVCINDAVNYSIDSTVLLSSFSSFVGGNWLCIAVALCREAVCFNPEFLNQVVPDTVGTSFREFDIVFVAASVVRMSFDDGGCFWVFLQELGNFAYNCVVFRFNG